jgi:hypothetical protein
MARTIENNWFAYRIPTGCYLTVLPAECQATGAFMQATGELIRLLNYVDDIAATLRRVHVAVPTLTPEERKRLAEYMRKSDPNFIAVLEILEKGEK